MYNNEPMTDPGCKTMKSGPSGVSCRGWQLLNGDDSPEEFENLINSEAVLKEFREFVSQE